MGLDFKNYDEVTKKENEIEQIIYMQKPNRTNINGLIEQINNNDKIMLATLMSMLYKVRSKSIHMKEKIAKSAELEQDWIFMTEEIIWNLYKQSKNQKQIKKFILENSCILEEILLKYYSEKNISYIGSKSFIDIILKQNGQKEVLALNPYMITQLLDYQQKPLTKEEQIIREVTDYHIDAQQYYDNPKDLDYVKHLLYTNNTPDELHKKVLFMISNVYQETKENNDSFYGKLMYILEITNYKPLNIFNYINNDHKMFRKILERFLNYNINIEEGRLEELENKPTSTYAKKIYRKNP